MQNADGSFRANEPLFAELRRHLERKKRHRKWAKLGEWNDGLYVQQVSSSTQVLLARGVCSVSMLKGHAGGLNAHRPQVHD